MSGEKLVKRGDNFLLVRRLAGFRTDRFIDYKIYNAANPNAVLFSGDLALSTSGFYFDNSRVANNTGTFIVEYRVFVDQEKTVQDITYSPSIETIRVEDFVEEIREIIDFGDGSAI